MKPTFILGVLVFALSGCTSIALQRQQAAWQQAQQIAMECKEKHLAGEFTGHVASVHCSTDRARQVMAASGYPHMDLVDLFLAYRMALAQRVDDGKLSGAEASLQVAELLTRLGREEQRRNLVAQEAYSQQLQNYGVLLQGLATWNQPLQPRQPLGPITCSRSGTMVTCY
jgi:hypothetical protein